MKFCNIFTHPIAAALGWIVGVLSAIFTVYGYVNSRAYPEISYYVNPATAPVVVQGKTSALTVAFNGKEVTDNVTAVQITVWNAGKKAISGTDILNSVILRAPGRILEVTTKGLSRPLIEMKAVASQSDSSEVRLNWKILEFNDGATFQIIHAGTAKPSMKIEGAFVGQPSILQLTQAGVQTPQNSIFGIHFSNRASLILTALLAMGASVFVSYGNSLPRKTTPEEGPDENPPKHEPVSGKFDLWFLVTISVLVVMLAVYSKITTRPQPPDFSASGYSSDS